MQVTPKQFLKAALGILAGIFLVSDAQAQTTNYNYVVTYTPRVPVTTASTLPTATVSNVNQTVQYFDGLGRPVQTVRTKASAAQRDVVQITTYDQFDREVVKYLPYVDSANSTNYGTYKTTAVTDQLSFYANPTSAKWNAPGVVTTPYPTNVTRIEASPLNRPLEQGFAGDNWQLNGTTGTTNPGHTIKIQYASNDASSLTSGDGYWARLYTVVFSYPSGSYDYRNSLSTSGPYPANSLYVTVTKNENWSASQSDTTLNTTQEYKDLFGRVVLKRVINYNTSTSSREVMSTYYVYDEYNNLIFVLPPMANPDGGSITQPQLDNYCYQYRYDGRNRMIYKKIPGKGWQFIVYNNLNQVIATQDSVQRMKSTQQVSYNKYDSQGRLIASGYYAVSGISPGTDDWSTLQAAASAQTVNWETKSASGVYSSVTIPTSGTTPLVTNYYDDYNVSGIPYTVSSGVSVMTRGLLTVSQPSILNNPGYFMWTVHYYDDWGRDIRTYRMHFLGGTADVTPNNYDLVTNYYNFANQVDTTIRKHYTKASTTTPKVIVSNYYTYDQVGRKLTNTEQLTGMNGVAQTAVTISSLQYNQLGQEYNKSVDNSLQTINYTYNERGWLTALTPQVSAHGGGNYAETIYYNSPTGTAAPQYNGNISQFAYNSPHTEAANGVHIPTATNAVNYTYDNLNRLTKSQSTLAATDETVTYDLEGNINSLVRTGSGVNTGTFGYTYTTGTNKLLSVTENSVPFKSYQYDGNGNATSDSTTKSLTYNILNLPMTFTVNGTTKATYYYDAEGNKIKDVSTTYGTWDYIEGIVYKNENIDFIQTEEGRASLWADSLYHYSYDLKDYLGNVRASYADSTHALQIVQENDYYPFGLTVKTFDNASGDRYLYNGKEEQYDLTNQYDFGARFYNSVIARWTVVDQLAEKSRRFSQYVYGLDNPIRFIDADGMSVTAVNGGYSFTNDIEGDDATDAFNFYKTTHNNSGLTGSVGIITFGKEQVFGEAIKFLFPSAIYRNINADAGHGGYDDFYRALKYISDRSGNGIGFLAIFSHGDMDPNVNRPTYGEGMIFANNHLNPQAGNVYTSDLTKLESSIKTGDIRFSMYSIIYLGGCNTATDFGTGTSFAMEMARVTGAHVYGAKNAHMDAQNPNDKNNTTFFPDPDDVKYGGGQLVEDYWPFGATSGTETPVSNPVIDVAAMIRAYLNLGN